MPRPPPVRDVSTRPGIIRLAVMIYVRFRRMPSLRKCAGIHAFVDNRVDQESSLSSRGTVKANRAERRGPRAA